MYLFILNKKSLMLFCPPWLHTALFLWNCRWWRLWSSSMLDLWKMAPSVCLVRSWLEPNPNRWRCAASRVHQGPRHVVREKQEQRHVDADEHAARRVGEAGPRVRASRTESLRSVTCYGAEAECNYYGVQHSKQRRPHPHRPSMLKIVGNNTP